ncbi:gp53-like domain-containing protein [Paraburkholderia terrae]|uniref:gp53-like domain-containing protein n=1 Tax=Paraburkholderia terrae TaxID=311230 RepID=UPI0020516659|nr:hypothetical protein [Paraburkholderia terrae]BDC38931.1 hypothetical protein PTKU15_22280 [Paraburkholderia terrae]
MKRQTVYVGAVPLESDILQSNKNAFVAIGHVLQDMLGTSTLFSGLGCVPTGPAGMTVNVNPGRAYSLQATDTGPWSSLTADATPLMKQGILLAAQNFACPAPGTAGFSINYLIQGAFQEVDTGSTVLPYYNAANPAQAFNGPNGTGTSQTTARDNTVQLQLKTGVAATTGSQITPTPDSGFTGLWVVTVAFGQVTITSTSIAQYAGAPFLPASLLAMIQQGSANYAVATGTANAHVAAFQPPITARVDGMVLRYKAPAANTGALTFSEGLGAVAVVGAAHSALQGGETAVNGDVWLQWNSSIGGGSYVMLDSTGGAAQVGAATQSNHAVNLGQFASSQGANGYQKLPNGMIIQWGSAVTSNGSVVVTFPIAFPNAVLSNAGWDNSASTWTNSNVSVYGSYSPTRTGMSIRQGNWNGSAFSVNGAGSVNWIAIGN